MTDTGYDSVAPEQLRIGLYVEPEPGWMAHPFPVGGFKIRSQRQIEPKSGYPVAGSPVGGLNGPSVGAILLLT